MNTSFTYLLAYLPAASLALILLANSARPSALIASAVSITMVVSVLASLVHGPEALTDVIGSLADLLHGTKSP